VTLRSCEMDMGFH